MKAQHREFAMASGEMTEGEFETFLKTVFLNLAERTVEATPPQPC